MRRFNFRLATLLRVRERALDSAASDLRQIEADIETTRQYLERLRDAEVRVEQETLRMMEAGEEGEEAKKHGAGTPESSVQRLDRPLTGAELSQRRAYSEFLRLQLRLTQRRLSVLNEHRETKRRAWTERRREWKAVQKVRERERARWQTRETREEQKVIDEIAQNTAGGPAAASADTGSGSEAGSALKAVLVVVLVMALSIAMLYSVRLVGKKHIAFLNSGIMLGGGAAGKTTGEAAVAGPVVSASHPPTPTPDRGGMLITSDMIEETLRQVETERIKLQEREAMLAAWEERLNRRQAELEELISEYDGLRAQIEADLAEQRALKEWREGEERRQREANIKRLSRLYEKTRAKEAALMMLELDKEQAQEVLLAMDERYAVRILGEMSKANPQRASELLGSISDEPDRLMPKEQIP